MAFARARRRLLAWLLAASLPLAASGLALAQEHAPAAAAATAPGVAAPGVEANVEHGLQALEAGHPVEGEHGAGMPQLEPETYLSQIFWLIVSFCLLYWLLATRALPRLTEILEARRDRIDGDLDRAARLRAEAEEAEKRYQEVVAAAQAKAQAELRTLTDRLSAEASERQAVLDRELAAKLAAAEQRIGAARTAALAEVQDVAAEVAQTATQRLVGISVSREEARAALDRVMAEAA